MEVTNPQLCAVQRIVLNPQFLLHLTPNFGFENIILVISLERKFMDSVREVMTVAVVLEIGNQFVYMLRTGAERASRRQMNVSNDLVEANPTSNVTPFISLFLELV